MTIEELIERVERATAGSRELDWLIAEHFGGIPTHSIREIGFDYDWWRRPGEYALWKATDSEGRSVELWQPKPVTGSLDAAMALAVKLFDNGAVDIYVAHRTNRGIPSARAEIVGPDVDQAARAMTPALALCLCILRAHAEKESQP